MFKSFSNKVTNTS